MMFLLFYSILMYGCCNLLVYGSGPFDFLLKLRAFANQHIPMLGKMLKCMMCTSTNLGWIISLINIILFPYLILTPCSFLFGSGIELWYIKLLGDAFFTSGIVWLIHSVQDMCEKISNYYANPEEDE